MCLHCRHEARLEAQARRRVLAARAGAATLAAIVIIGFGTAAISAVRSAGRSEPVTVAQADTAPVVMQQASPAPVAVAAPAAAPETPAPAPAQPAFAPVVREGLTSLGAGITAERSGHEVIVRFDTQGLRTRRYDKFATTVRATLPRVYGAASAAIADSVTTAFVQQAGSLTGDLPARGFTVGRAEQALSITPITRQGEDGPLVVAYRVTAKR